MTREETISILEESKRQNEIMRDNPSTFWASNSYMLVYFSIRIKRKT